MPVSGGDCADAGDGEVSGHVYDEKLSYEKAHAKQAHRDAYGTLIVIQWEG